MKRIFVKTSNAARFLAGIESLNDRGAEEACLVVVDGEPGLGKSAVIQWWAVTTGSIFLRAKKQWTPRWMLRELLTELDVEPAYSFEAMYKQALEALMARAYEAQQDDRTFGVVIDEIDHISRSPSLLETLRDLSDMLEFPFVLVGMGRVKHHLSRFPQIASRVGQYVEFKPGTLPDVKAMITALCEVPVQDDLVALTHEAAAGKYREIKEAIAAIERFGRRNGGKLVGIAAMAGEVLLNDRRTGAPITVKPNCRPAQVMAAD